MQFAFNKQYELRSSTKGDLNTEACRTNYLNNSFSYSSKTIWNIKFPFKRNGLPCCEDEPGSEKIALK